jgi:putative transposase
MIRRAPLRKGLSRLTHRTAPGCTSFMRTKTWGNRASFQVPQTGKILIESLLRYKQKSAYLLHEFVVMPDHLHLLLTPCRETSVEKATGMIKGGSSLKFHRVPGHKMEIRQPGFQEETVRDARDYLHKAEYIHMNPVRSHLVEKPEDGVLSSAAGDFKLDAAPQQLGIVASGAKAPSLGPDGDVGPRVPTP